MMSDEARNIKGIADRTLGKKLSRRRLMGTGAASLGAAVFAGGAASSAIAGGAFGGGRVVVAQDGGTEYHGAYPYVDLGSGGHFNTFVTDGILPNGTVYGELIMQPLG